MDVSTMDDFKREKDGVFDHPHWGEHLAVTRQHDSMAMLARNLNIGRRYRFFIYFWPIL